MDVHLRDLRYFVAVAEEGSVTAAAQRLFISQPALSKQIRSLERQVKTPLFERLPREIRLTAAGQELLPHARALLAGWTAAERDLVRTSTSTLVVGMHTSPGRGLLPLIREGLLALCPDVDLELRQQPWSDRTAGLADQSVDVTFAWSPQPGRPHRSIVLSREPRLVALPRGHRLAGRRRVRMADLLDEPFLALPESAGPLRDFWLAVEQRDGRPPRIAGVINDPESTYEAVTSGVGVCLLAAGNAPIFDRGGVVMPEVTDLPPAELVLAWDERRMTTLSETFVRLCAEIVADRAAVA
ncbi:MAG TPA: LysR substrate-binding domain-containing protein [Pseudonocardia sp.]